MTLLERRPELLLVAVTVVWGSTFIVTKGLLRDAPPLLYVTVRFAVAAALLLALFPRALRPGRRLLTTGLVLGSGHAIGLSLQVFGQLYTTASKSAFVTALSTVLTPLLGFALYRERPRAQQLAGVLMAGLGLGLLTWPGVGADWNRGDLYSLACAAVYAWVIVETARRSRGEDAMVVSTLQIAMAALVFALLLGGAHLLLRLLPPDQVPEVVRLELRPLPRSPSALAALAYLTLLCTVVTLTAQTWAMGRMTATQAAVVFALEPLIATGLAVAVEPGSEWPGSRGAIGAFSILAGLLIAEVRTRSRPDEPS